LFFYRVVIMTSTPSMSTASEERSRLLRLARSKTAPQSHPTTSTTAAALRGVFCAICNAYGTHVPTCCPFKANEGCPENLRDNEARKRKYMYTDVDELSAGPGSGSGSGFGLDIGSGSGLETASLDALGLPVLSLQSATIRATYCDLPDDFIPSNELDALVSKRPDAPSFLRCYACCILAVDAMWCACCDVVACKTCVYAIEKDPQCPKCGGHCDADTGVFVVTAIRVMIDAWKKNTMEATDVYARQATALLSSTSASRVVHKR
jgi:hypothetical protein